MAAEAIVSVILEQFTKSTIEEIRKGVGLVVGASEAVRNLASNFLSIQAVLMDAEQKQVNNYAVRVWLDNLKQASYDLNDVLDEWNTKMMKLQVEKKVCLFFFSPDYCFRRIILRCEIALKIKEINERLDVIAKEKDRYNLNIVYGGSINKPQERVKTTSFIDESEIYGRDEEKHTLVSKLLSESNEERKVLRIISIVGMGGIGKTTLAQLAYNNHDVVNNFEKRIWVCVSEPFDELRIAKAILEALTGDNSNLGEWQALLIRIENFIEGKKFVLVLDDVWTVDHNKWNPLYNCLKRGNLHKSKILVTTRKETVASMIESTDIIVIKELSEEKCWSFFTRLAFFGRTTEECRKLEEVGKEIVGKCKGLPLAIKIVGSLLRLKRTREEWQRISDSEMWNLEEIKKDLFSVLLLSYNDLPCMIRRCFSFCAIFPKDLNMRKDKLIQLWMAQGYLGLDQNEEIEVIGQEYFDDLAARSFFQEFKKDDDDNIIGCKMHDIVHDFAKFLTENECLTLEFYDSNESKSTISYEKVHHLMVILGKDVSFPKSMLNAKMLRSLFIYGGDDHDFSLFTNVQNKLFDEWTCLRVLSLNMICSDWRASIMILRKIGKLIHLRYLDLRSCVALKELPETLCELYNLQTLNLTECEDLQKLPRTMGKLINLRHLLNDRTDGVRYMPKGMERLTCLRTLREFVVSDAVNHSKACTLKCLENLNSLRGSLHIKHLGNVIDVDAVKKAQLKNKKNLISLTFDFEVDGEDGSMNERDEDVLESLQPPLNLEELTIYIYRGNTMFCSWNMMSLTKLRTLTIDSCQNCKCLPPLGKLPSLESLNIHFMTNVKRVSNEFLGIEIDGTSSSSPSLIIAFPKLKSLSFWSMPEWEEWDHKITKRAEEEEDVTNIMPCLCSLKIQFCFKLKALPEHLFQITTLRELNIWECPIIEERCHKDKGDYWPKISHIPTIIL